MKSQWKKLGAALKAGFKGENLNIDLPEEITEVIAVATKAVSKGTIISISTTIQHYKGSSYEFCTWQSDYFTGEVLDFYQINKPPNITEFSAHLMEDLKETYKRISLEANTTLPVADRQIYAANFPCIKDYQDGELNS